MSRYQTDPDIKTVLFMDATAIGYLDHDNFVKFRERKLGEKLPRQLAAHQWDYCKPVQDLAEEAGLVFYPCTLCKSVLEACSGRSLDGLRDELAKRARHAAAARQARRESEEQWRELLEKFDGYVICIEDADIYPTGVTVTVLLAGSKTFREQSAWMKTHGKHLPAYVRENIKTAGRISKKTRLQTDGLLPFCRATSIVLARDNTVQIKFDLDERIQKALTTENENEKT